MTLLLAADIHLNEKPRDQDRWNLFGWLHKMAIKHSVSHVLFLGDMTDEKDRHPAELVNKLVRNLHELSQRTNVIFVKGNHDYINEASPFFAFTQMVGNVTFVNEPLHTDLTIEGKKVPCLLLPSTRDYKESWNKLNFSDVQLVFTHQTFDGAKTENGTELSGIPPSYFADFKGQVYSGDIHVPQRVAKNITYVGAPYRVKFGDTFTPRCLLVQRKGTADLHFPGKARELIEISGKDVGYLKDKVEHLKLGDQVKLRVFLSRKNYPDWPAIKKQAQEVITSSGLELCGTELKTLPEKQHDTDEPIASSDTSPEYVLGEYIAGKKLGNGLSKVGKALLREAQE